MNFRVGVDLGALRVARIVDLMHAICTGQRRGGSKLKLPARLRKPPPLRTVNPVGKKDLRSAASPNDSSASAESGGAHFNDANMWPR